MKYIQQILIILTVSYLGEILNELLPLPVSGNIYGMILMLFLLLSGTIKLHQIKEVGYFFIDIMPIFFIPSAVGIINKKNDLITVWWKLLIVIFFTTIFVMAISGTVTQFIICHKNKHKNGG